jgi:hypothetical protein
MKLARDGAGGVRAGVGGVGEGGGADQPQDRDEKATPHP